MMPFQRIRVLLVGDSSLTQGITLSLSHTHSIEIVGSFHNATRALTGIRELVPDVVMFDLDTRSFEGKGLECLSSVVRTHPGMRFVVIGQQAIKGAALPVAVDFVRRHVSGADSPAFNNEIVKRIKIAAAMVHSSKQKAAPPPPVPSAVAAPSVVCRGPYATRVIAIGASTGGTDALLTILKQLPANTPGIVVAQHMPPFFTKMFAERLNQSVTMEVREAADRDRLQSGLVLIAPGDRHITLAKGEDGGYLVRCKQGERLNGYRPSVDVLFRSVAQCGGADALGVILTGMGSDGAEGLLEMRRRGAYTIGQDEASSAVYGMPLAAYECGAVCKQLPVQEIAPAILRRFDMLA